MLQEDGRGVGTKMENYVPPARRLAGILVEFHPSRERMGSSEVNGKTDWVSIKNYGAGKQNDTLNARAIGTTNMFSE